MHAHDRTLLSSLGFRDADKKDRRHDLAAQFLALPEQASRIYHLCPRPPVAREISRNVTFEGPLFEHHLTKGSGQYRSTIGFLDLVLKFDTEVTRMVTRRDHRHMVPFLRDLSLMANGGISCWSEGGEWQWGYYEELPPDRGAIFPRRRFIPVLPPTAPADSLSWRKNEQGEYQWFIRQETWDEPETTREGWWLVVEVKIGAVSVGDIIRQIGLYETYATSCGFIVATAFDMTAGDVKMLGEKGIHHLRLGAGFEEFCRQQEERPQLSDSPEF